MIYFFDEAAVAAAHNLEPVPGPVEKIGTVLEPDRPSDGKRCMSFASSIVPLEDGRCQRRSGLLQSGVAPGRLHGTRRLLRPADMPRFSLSGIVPGVQKREAQLMFHSYHNGGMTRNKKAAAREHRLQFRDAARRPHRRSVAAAQGRCIAFNYRCRKAVLRRLRSLARTGHERHIPQRHAGARPALGGPDDLLTES